MIQCHSKLAAEGTNEPRLAQLNFNICQELSNELRMLRVVRTNGYPEVIDFTALAGCINKMSNSIKNLIRAATSGDLQYLEGNFVSRHLVYDLVQANIGATRQDALVNFSSLRYSAIPDMIQEKSWPG